MNHDNTFDALIRDVLTDGDVRAAYLENNLRRELANTFEVVRARKGLSFQGLAREMGTSVSQVQRLLHHEQGGSLTLRTICRAADALDLRVSIHAREKCARGAKIIGFGKVSDWQQAPVRTRVSRQPPALAAKHAQSGAWRKRRLGGEVCDFA